MTARYDAEVAMLRDQPPPWAVRIGHDADELRRLADWLEALRDGPMWQQPDTRDELALYYFRLSANFRRLSKEHYKFALSLTRVIP